MSAPRRRRKEEEEDHPDERWMASYMDMVTVLMCMFIVLFAMSTVDQQKFEQLRDSLATGFGTTESSTVDTAVGIIATPEQVDDKEILDPDAVLPAAAEAPDPDVVEVDDPAALAAAEVQDLTVLRDRIAAGLQEKGLSETVRFDLDERGLTIRLVSSEMFFAPDLADLTAQAVEVLQTVGPIVAPTAYDISVEGHTAQVRQITEDALDWELSSSRAVTVLRYLVEESGVDFTRVRAVGLGESQPLTSGTSAAELAQNRRVDIVVLSSQSEAVRELIPGIVSGHVEPAGQ